MTTRRLLASLLLTLALLPVAAASAQEATPERAPDGEIIGGDEADPGEYPFQVGLLHHAVATRWNAQFCGGTLISPDTVLTAGHCVVGTRASEIDVLAEGQHQRVRLDGLEFAGGLSVSQPTFVKQQKK